MRKSAAENKLDISLVHMKLLIRLLIAFELGCLSPANNNNNNNKYL